ncbi:uncharacterized protein FIBRA_00820 [Fibroporia radiculosa]|uniref:AB hydrolase-1 domain-containing protein n=1 Tax=Fibroporia radiculosa TaxID=599839 RepID=J4GIP2_9APHY|nr:uncharacterized protein FIBRA_00820 [Fibroporia radiculosa]CCL98815.1 predicted protein [Fibroporia radiculosa]
MLETTGKIDFTYNGEIFQTWYKVVGGLKSGGRPLIVLHGGPGVSHHYMLPHDALAASHNIPVIFYDQIGNGESSHLPGKPKEFWTIDLFIDELENVFVYLGIRDDFDMLGHSWGGMMATHYVAHRQLVGLRRLVLGGSAPSMQLWQMSMSKLVAEMPEEFRETVKKHEENGTTDSPEFQLARLAFYKKHLFLLNDWPEVLAKAYTSLSQNPTVYHAMMGPSEFTITGTLKTWSVVDRLHLMSVPTLLINSAQDEAQDVCVSPLFMKIPHVKWVQLSRSSHMHFMEEPERYFSILGEILTN